MESKNQPVILSPGDAVSRVDEIVGAALREAGEDWLSHLKEHVQSVRYLATSQWGTYYFPEFGMWGRRHYYLAARRLLVDGEEKYAAKVVCVPNAVYAVWLATRLAWESRCEASFRQIDESTWEAASPNILLGLVSWSPERRRLQQWARRARRGVRVGEFRTDHTVEPGLTFIVRPPEVHLDNDRRPHREDGPALIWGPDFPKPEWRDPIYAWHGTIVPARAIVGTYTHMDIEKEPNLETRRVMIEKLYGGMGGFMKFIGAEPVHKDETGELFRVQVGRGRNRELAYVHVTDPSTGREYWLRVPPSMRTAREAVAWTFGLNEQEYRPAAEA